MRHFTVHQDPAIDRAIARDLLSIQSVVTEEIGGLHSLVLVGGFGRGEGSVLLENGEPAPLNDYDVVMIVEEPVDDDASKAVAKHLASVLHIRLVDLIPIAREDLPSLPATQFNYDLKYGGYCFWGRDPLPLIPNYSSHDITETSGERLLRNRMICLLECYTDEFKDRTPTEEERFFLMNQSTKAILACTEALLIKKGKYHHLCARRTELFPMEFPGMERLASLNRIATEFKLRPTRKVDLDMIGYWHLAVKEYTALLGWYLNNGLLSDTERWDMTQDDSRGGRTIYQHLRTAHPGPNPMELAERTEMCLLGAKCADRWHRTLLLAEARRTMRRLTGKRYWFTSWEQLRRESVERWFALAH